MDEADEARLEQVGDAVAGLLAEWENDLTIKVLEEMLKQHQERRDEILETIRGYKGDDEDPSYAELGGRLIENDERIAWLRRWVALGYKKQRERGVR